MVFNVARLRVKELAEALNVDSPEIIATCTLLKIPASSPLSSLSIKQSKEIIDFIQKTNNVQNNDNK
ncbi:translation initiation factor IF-2 N-terminal domain-containing protein [Prochlorococcus marinus]|uniref:translation initiation factor IF-2 N-terminal domain-containing protein n=1 Tax=Prochlorococcus marinus TaxID=1219 RepID=UPI0022B33DF4|nr:translation initiation factor IF-2 N-terminal domain-containing protein [Prochlorococcus marinus]